MIAIAYLWYMLQSVNKDKSKKDETETNRNIQRNFPDDPSASECAETSRKPEDSKCISSHLQQGGAGETEHRCSQLTHNSGFCGLPVCARPPVTIISETDSSNGITCPFCQNTHETVKSETGVSREHNYPCYKINHETSDAETGIIRAHGCSQTDETNKLQECTYTCAHTGTCSLTHKTSDLEADVLANQTACFIPVKTEDCSQCLASATDNHPTTSASCDKLAEEHSTGLKEATESHDTQSHDHLEGAKVQKGPTFNPPVYIQRYSLVQEVLRHHGVESVVDFGCANCKMIYYLKNVETIRRIALVDTDKNLVDASRQIVRPDVFERAKPRATPLTVSLFHGSAGDWDHRVSSYQAASLVELIEHLQPSMLEQVRHNVFGQLQPSIIIVTTPNADFNVLFPNFTGFRHWDHKFEWTRAEFEQWCNDVCQEYGYAVRYTGVGDPPPEMGHVGFCSQAAIFTKTSATAKKPEEEKTYALISEEVYPIETRTSAERLANEAEYTVNWLCSMESVFSEDYNSQAIIPVSKITGYVLERQEQKDNWTEKDVVEYLQSHYTLTQDGVNVIIQLEDDSSSD